MADRGSQELRPWTAAAYVSALIAALHLAATIRAVDLEGAAEVEVLGVPLYLCYLVLTLLWALAVVLSWQRTAGIAVVAIAVLTVFVWMYTAGSASLVLILASTAVILVAFGDGRGLPGDWGERVRRFSRPG
jgi:hypothetical protein